MDKAAEIKRIWRERFNDTKLWMSEVYPRIYRDDDALVHETDGRVVSSLLLRRFEMTYRGQLLNVGFIYGAATLRGSESQGYMSQLVCDALQTARRRGDALVALRPTQRRLYGFFNRFGFVTSFFVDEQRYTALHKFPYDEEHLLVEESIYDYDELAKAYNRLCVGRQSCMMHSAEDFRTIMIDNGIDRGMVAVARSTESGEIVAFSICNVTTNTIAVRELVAIDDNAANAVLASFTRRRPDRMVVIEAYPERSGVKYSSRGMARIVDVEKVLQTFAAIDPKIRMTLRVTDPIILENNGCFYLKNGKGGRLQSDSCPEPDLEVSVDVLTAIMFSSERMSEIFSLPTCRPFMSLML